MPTPTVVQNEYEKDSTSVKSCQAENAPNGGCKDFNCPHNMFWVGLFKKGWHGLGANWSPHETGVSRTFDNCMVNLDRPLSLEEIGEMYGITKQWVSHFIRKILDKLRTECGQSSLSSHKHASERINKEK